MKEKRKELSKKHPYYCSDSNFYSNEPSQDWETMTDFLKEFSDADIDMNLIFRWDIIPNKSGRYYAQVFIIKQRKGIFAPHYIKRINEEEAKLFEQLAIKHWKRIVEIWNPISKLGWKLWTEPKLKKNKLPY